MPTFRVKFAVRPVSADALAQFRALVEAGLSARPVTKAHHAWVFDPDSKQVIGEWELGTRTAWRTFREWFVAHRAELAALVNGRLTVCRCSHDDAVVLPCTATESEFVEVRL